MENNCIDKFSLLRAIEGQISALEWVKKDPTLDIDKAIKSTWDKWQKAADLPCSGFAELSKELLKQHLEEAFEAGIAHQRYEDEYIQNGAPPMDFERWYEEEYGAAKEN